MLLGFKEQFVEPIQQGTKNFTLRRPRKHTPKVGDRLYMYTGLRTRHCFKISDNHTLMAIQSVRIAIEYIPDFVYCKLSKQPGMNIKIFVDGRKLSDEEINDFVKRDGFADSFEFGKYWLSGKKKNKTRLGCYVQQFHWTDKTF